MQISTSTMDVSFLSAEPPSPARRLRERRSAIPSTRESSPVNSATQTACKIVIPFQFVFYS